MRQAKAQQLTELILTVFQLNGALIDWGDKFSATEGLTSARWQMLGALALAGQPLTAPQIAANMGVTRQGAQKQLNLLARDGLVETRDNPQHKRSPLYVLTKRGKQTYSRIDTRWNGHVAQLAAVFSSTELDTAAKVLAGLVDVYTHLGSHHET
ncbi:MarR family transcriptional regulator [Alcaligenaceae bacterium]|nr:MarR family transcriptional regulator [Alcaligenaceae bacterium]